MLIMCAALLNIDQTMNSGPSAQFIYCKCEAVIAQLGER